MSKAQETKTFSAIATKILDADQGIVEHIVAVMGNIDRGQDVIHPGAFAKTLDERGLKAKVLDQHDTRSVEAVIGKPLALREISRFELPPELVLQYPEATGALLAKTQFLLDTNRGREVFNRIKAGAVDEYSIGYDPIQTDYATVDTPTGKQTIRNLREVRLWEYSPVVFGMNPATSTLSAKEKGMEKKPYRAIQEDGKWRVYKLGEDGEPTGQPLGEHETEEEAQAQVRALYANEPEAEEEDGKAMRSEADGQHPAGHYLVVEDAEKPSTWHLRIRDAAGEVDHRLMGAAWAALHGGYRGNRYEGPGKQEAIARLKRLYEAEGMDVPKADEGPEDEKAGRVLAKRNAERIARALAEINDVLKDAGLLVDEADSDEESAEDKEDEPEPVIKAGPVQPPTSKLAELQILKLQLDTMEVEQ